jgi:Na+/glutamate symporter
MLEWISTFFAIFFTDIFYVYYLKSVEEGHVLKSSLWATVVFLVACFAVINYTTNHWLLIPAGFGAFAGTYVGMILRKHKL